MPELCLAGGVKYCTRLHQLCRLPSLEHVQAGSANNTAGAAAFLKQAMQPVRGLWHILLRWLAARQTARRPCGMGRSLACLLPKPPHGCRASTACVLLQMPPATLNMLLNITQPLMKQTGQLRWAMNNVAGGYGPWPRDVLAWRPGNKRNAGGIAV